MWTLNGLGRLGQCRGRMGIPQATSKESHAGGTSECVHCAVLQRLGFILQAGESAERNKESLGITSSLLWQEISLADVSDKDTRMKGGGQTDKENKEEK